MWLISSIKKERTSPKQKEKKRRKETIKKKKIDQELLSRGCRSFKFLDGRWPHGGSCRVWWRVLNSVHPSLSLSPSKVYQLLFLFSFLSFIVFFPTTIHPDQAHRSLPVVGGGETGAQEGCTRQYIPDASSMAASCRRNWQERIRGEMSTQQQRKPRQRHPIKSCHHLDDDSRYKPSS